MASFNKVILIGNMVADPELKTTQSGINVCSFRIAVGRKYAKTNESPQTDFIDIVTWRSQAEFVSKYFSKGKPILVCGTIQSRNWEDKDGKKRTTVEVVAEEVSFVERKSVSESYGEPSAAGTPYVSGYEAFAPKLEEISSDDDDLPF